MALSQRNHDSFTADYESGNIKLQQEELNAGAFYTKDNLPEIPKKLSLARKLIDAWLEENGLTAAPAALTRSARSVRGVL